MAQKRTKNSTLHFSETKKVKVEFLGEKQGGIVRSKKYKVRAACRKQKMR